ncbi:MAG TPA: type II toxin-antitoxin system VapC family toxin [Methylocystis sp.]|nr:type II toxin-antitoxin system VapC family toxin [Methylocystis sp.]
MKYLLDTNVLSEFRRLDPDANLTAWLRAADEQGLHVSVATLGELRAGVACLERGRRKANLDEWLRRDLPLRFRGRILDITMAIADLWGVLSAEAKRRGVGVGAVDKYLAATAIVHDMTLVTRNTKDFEAFDLSVLNPWKD